MEEIIKVNEMEEATATAGYEELEPVETEAEGGNGPGKVLIGVGALAVTGLLLKNRKKIKAKKKAKNIKKLEKEGYVVYKPEDLEPSNEFDDVEDIGSEE